MPDERSEFKELFASAQFQNWVECLSAVRHDRKRWELEFSRIRDEYKQSYINHKDQNRIAGELRERSGRASNETEETAPQRALAPLTPEDRHRLVEERYPLPVAHQYVSARKKMKECHWENQLTHIFSCFESIAHFLVGLTVSAYGRYHARDEELNLQLRQALEEQTWSDGHFLFMLTPLLTAKEDWISKLPLPRLSSLLENVAEYFNSPECVLRGFPRGRNDWAHARHAGGEAAAKACLDEGDWWNLLGSELERLRWLTDWRLVVPLDVEKGIVRGAMILRGQAEKLVDDFGLNLVLGDAQCRRSGICERQSPLLVSADRKEYLSLFPFLRYDGGVLYFLLNRDWAELEKNPESLRKLTYVTYSDPKGEARPTEIQARAGETWRGADESLADPQAIVEARELLKWFQQKAPKPLTIPEDFAMLVPFHERVLHPYLLQGQNDDFRGRLNELEYLDRWIDRHHDMEDVRLLCLWAWGGGGKSMLTWEWVNRVKSRLSKQGYLGVLWCSFYATDFNFNEFVREALAFVTGRAGGNDPEQATKHRSQLEVELLEILKSNRYLFILDGIERELKWYREERARATEDPLAYRLVDANDIPPGDRQLVHGYDANFLDLLRDCGESRFLVTSRLKLSDLESEGSARPHVRFYELPPIDSPSAIRLWRRGAPQDDTSDGQLGQMLMRIDNHPLLINAFSRRVRDYRTYAHWRAAQAGQTALDEHYPGNAVERYSLVLHYAFEGLPEDSKRVLDKIFHQKDPTTYDQLVALLVDPGQMTRETLNGVLRDLVERRLLGQDAKAQQFEMHPVVRSYVWKRISNAAGSKTSPEKAVSVTRPDRVIRTPADLKDVIRDVGHYVDKRLYDAAWKSIRDTIYEPFRNKAINGRRTLLELLEKLQPDESRGSANLMLPLLARRADQADVLSRMSTLYSEVGDTGRSVVSNRWATAIYYQLKDTRNYLSCLRERTWQMLYTGKLKETLEELAKVYVEARKEALADVAFPCLLWCTLAAAIGGRGEMARQLTGLEIAGQIEHRKLSFSMRWWLQGLAECAVYLGEYPLAMRISGQIAGGSEDRSEDRGQYSWELVTEGMALAEMGSDHFFAARSRLVDARKIAEDDEYHLIECLAEAFLIKVAVRSHRFDDARQHLKRYKAFVRAWEYSIPACEASLAAAELHLAEARLLDDPECPAFKDQLAEAVSWIHEAVGHARVGAGGFCYALGLKKSLKLGNAAMRLGAEVEMFTLQPSPESPLLATVGQGLQELEEDLKEEQEEVKAEEKTEETVAPPAGDGDGKLRPTQPTPANAMGAAAQLGQESEEVRSWWAETEQAMGASFSRAILQQLNVCGLSLGELRQEVSRSPGRNPFGAIANIELQRLRVGEERQLAAMAFDEKMAWLREATARPELLGLSDWARSREAQSLLNAISTCPLERGDTLVFLADAKRRLGLEHVSEFANVWWQRVEEVGSLSRQPLSLTLAESIAATGTGLDEFLTRMPVPNRACLRMAFLHAEIANREEQTHRISPTDGWTEDQITCRLEEVKWCIAWPDTTGSARKWWQAFEQENVHRRALVLRVAEELLVRKATITEFFLAYVYSNTDNIESNLHYLDYRRIKQKQDEDKKRRATGQASSDPTAPQPTDAFGGLDLDTRPQYATDVQMWTREHIVQRVEQIRLTLDWPNTTGSAHKWWTLEIEQKYRDTPQVVLRLAEELAHRQATITEFFLAYVYSNTENLLAVLHYFDYSRLKKAEEKARREKAAAAEAEKLAAEAEKHPEEPPAETESN